VLDGARCVLEHQNALKITLSHNCEQLSPKATYLPF
jgi:hypothetical protein